MRHLLDVNVWVALLDEAHVFHAQAVAFIERKGLKIASCPLVEKRRDSCFESAGLQQAGPGGL